jgi:COP9 signalosome complex subunit 5
MGLMQGKVVGDALVIMDSFALPVQGTETRVNAANEANEFMVQYIESSEKVRAACRQGAGGGADGPAGEAAGERRGLVPLPPRLRLLAVRHRREHADEQPAVPGPVRRRRRASLPSRTCSAPHARQIDPNRTISAGKVDIGAFRTYPAGYTPPAGRGSDEYQSIPLSKIEDFGVHAGQYYPLDVQVFTSALDAELLGLLWNKYWVNTLSQSPLVSVRFIASDSALGN